MRLLAVTSYYRPAYVYGGPVHSMSNLFEALVQQGVWVTVYTTNANGKNNCVDAPVAKPVDVNGVEVWYYPLSRIGLNFRSSRLAQAVENNVRQFDLVHIEGVWNYNFHVASGVCIRQHKPYVVVPRGTLLPWSLSQKKTKKKIYFEILVRNKLNKANSIYCTDATEADAIRSLGIQSQIMVAPNGINSQEFRQLPLRSYLRTKLEIPESARVLLFVGRLHHKKRPDIVVDVHTALSQMLPYPVHTIFVGPDEENIVPRLKQRLARDGTQKTAHFLGLLEHDALLSAYSAADLLLMPSEIASENFGMVAVEAMASGLPVLVTDGIPSGMWAQRYNAGLVSKPVSSAFIDNAMRMVSDKELLRLMGRNGINLVKSKFDRMVVAQQVAQNYKKIIAPYG